MFQTVKPFLTSTAACSGFYIGTPVIPIPAEGSAACAPVERQSDQGTLSLLLSVFNWGARCPKESEGC